MSRKLGRKAELVKKRYTATVAGPHPFMGVRKGETVELELTEHDCARYLKSGRIVDLEEVGESDEVAESEPGHGDPPVDTVHGEDAAHVTEEAGPEPEHK